MSGIQGSWQMCSQCAYEATVRVGGVLYCEHHRPKQSPDVPVPANLDATINQALENTREMREKMLESERPSAEIMSMRLDAPVQAGALLDIAKLALAWIDNECKGTFPTSLLRAAVKD